MTLARNDAEQLIWRELSRQTRAMLEGKLRGLYEHDSDDSAFDALALDKQQTLLLFAHRLVALNLWNALRRIDNVYGEGGVGLNFIAQPDLESTLRRRRDFTTMFAAHKDATGGFFERKQSRASLHFLYVGTGRERRWSVHFDLYSPLAFPHGTWRHWLHEKVRGETPDWRLIAQVLRGTDSV
ncbi:MAG: hypothetical protein ABR577_06115 [Pyrinomonadaceae bacterium]